MREVMCNLPELTERDRALVEQDDSIIAVYYGKKGGVVRAHDNYLRTLTPEQLRENYQRFNDVACKILLKYHDQMMAKQALEDKD